MKIKFLLKEANRFKKQTGLNYRSTEAMKLAADISDIIQAGGKIFIRFTNHPRLEMNYQFKYGNPIGIYAYNFPPNVTNTSEIIKILEDIYSGDERKVHKIMGDTFAFDKKYVIFFTYPSKNLWTFSKETEPSDDYDYNDIYDDEEDYDEEENYEYKDNLTTEEYEILLNKIYELCKDKIRKWASYEARREEDTRIFYDRMIDTIFQQDEEYRYHFRKTKDYVIYKILFWIAENWSNNYFSVDVQSIQKPRNRNAIIWAKLLRKLGITGISDLGTRTVGVEPSQAILLHPEKCKMVGIIDWEKIRKNFEDKKEAEVPSFEQLFRKKGWEEARNSNAVDLFVDTYLYDIYDHSLPDSLKIKILENTIKNPHEILQKHILNVTYAFNYPKDFEFINKNIDLITEYFNVYLSNDTESKVGEFYEALVKKLKVPEPVNFYDILFYVYYNKHINKALFKKYYKPIKYDYKPDMYMDIAINCIGRNEKYINIAKKVLMRPQKAPALIETIIRRRKETLNKIIGYKL